jgi:hypothetical protein
VVEVVRESLREKVLREVYTGSTSLIIECS